MATPLGPATLGTVIVFAPALYASKANVGGMLKDGGRGVTLGVRVHRGSVRQIVRFMEPSPLTTLMLLSSFGTRRLAEGSQRENGEHEHGADKNCP
jgi:hypothetical protein